MLVLLLVSCGSAKRAAKEAEAVAEVPKVVRAPINSNDRQRLDYLYQEAAKQKMLGNHVAAFDLLRHCQSIYPDAPEVLYDLALYRLLLRDDSLALQLLGRASALDPQNTYYKETLAKYYLQRNESEAALAQMEDLARLQPRRSDVLSQLVNLYSSLDRYEDAIRVLDRIEVLEGKMPAVSYRKFSLYMRLNDEKKAFAELESLCHEYPHEMSYRLAVGNQLLQAGRLDEALKVYDEVKAIEPQNTQLCLSMLQYYRQTEQDSLFTAIRDSLLYHPRTEPEIRMTLAKDLISEEMQDEKAGRPHVEETFQRLDSLFHNDLELLQLRAAFLATYEKDNEEAFADVMNRIHEQQPSNTQALFYLIQYYGEHKQFEHLEDLCRRGVLTHPEELICHFYLGIALYQQDKKAEALKAFQDGIVQKTEDSRPAMVADLYSLMGDVLHEMKREREAFAAYDSCLVYQDDNVGCLNNYAYYLSLLNTNLDRAEEMSYRTIRLEPDNKTYLDTYAWILFMKERYSEAQRYIDRVCPPDSADSVLLADATLSGVVFEHAGDIAALNGHTAQAMRFWKLAQQAGGDGLSAVLPKKIKLGKYVKEGKK